MNLYPIQHRCDCLHRVSPLGVLSCLCFAVSTAVVARGLAVFSQVHGGYALFLMLVLVFVPPALFAFGAFLGALGISRQRQASTVAGLGLNLIGAAAYLAWLGVVRG